jgi:hypothetical protein
MDKVSKANSQPPALKNIGARQFEYAFVKRKPPHPPSGTTASGFLKCVCSKSYCVGSIICVGCVIPLRTLLRTASSSTPLRTALSSPQLRPALSTLLRPVASHSVASPLRSCASSSCASPISVLSRTHRINRRAAIAMKVKRTAERLAGLIKDHQRALRQLVELSAQSSNQASTESSNPLSELRFSASRPRELCQSESSLSALRRCELRPRSSDPLRPQSSAKRESPLTRFALVAFKSPLVVSVASPVASVASSVESPALLGRSPKPTLH